MSKPILVGLEHAASRLAAIVEPRRRSTLQSVLEGVQKYYHFQDHHPMPANWKGGTRATWLENSFDLSFLAEMLIREADMVQQIVDGLPCVESLTQQHEEGPSTHPGPNPVAVGTNYAKSLVYAGKHGNPSVRHLLRTLLTTTARIEASKGRADHRANLGVPTSEAFPSASFVPTESVDYLFMAKAVDFSLALLTTSKCTPAGLTSREGSVKLVEKMPVGKEREAIAAILNDVGRFHSMNSSELLSPLDLAFLAGSLADSIGEIASLLSQSLDPDYGYWSKPAPWENVDPELDVGQLGMGIRQYQASNYALAHSDPRLRASLDLLIAAMLRKEADGTFPSSHLDFLFIVKAIDFSLSPGQPAYDILCEPSRS